MNAAAKEAAILARFPPQLRHLVDAEYRVFARELRRIRFRDGGNAEALLIALDDLSRGVERRGREWVDADRMAAPAGSETAFQAGTIASRGRLVTVERRHRRTFKGR
jgi:hypothetical protein